jgi:hypothetical protein
VVFAAYASLASGQLNAAPPLNRSSLSAKKFAMNSESSHDDYSRYGYDKEGIKFGLASMKWYGWGSPVGMGFFLVSIGGLLYLLHLAGLIGR